MRGLHYSFRILRGLFVLLVVQNPVRAQLAEWTRGFENPGVDGSSYSMATFDDGTGVGLYVGGGFQVAGTVLVNNIARWDGHSWSALGPGSQNPVTAMTVFDDGSGAQLYVAGYFPSPNYPYHTTIARWNGSVWSPLPSTNDEIDALVGFDDGSGPALYAGGHFLTGGSPGSWDVAKLSGSSWIGLGPGLGGTNSGDFVRTLLVHDDGAGGGPALYAGGQFSMSGSVPIEGLAKWNGSSWSAVGPGLDPPASVWSLAEYVDSPGSAPSLYASGHIHSVGGVTLNSVIRWDGASWSAPGVGVVGNVEALEVFDDGAGGGPALYAGGELYQPGGAPQTAIARWNGVTWTSSNWVLDTVEQVHALAGFTRGGVGNLYACGYFISGEGVNSECVARLEHGKWAGVGRGQGLDDAVTALCVRPSNGGQAQQLFAAGHFTIAGTTQAEGIARWDGASWSALGSGIDISFSSLFYVNALADYDDGSGTQLYATGFFYLAGGTPVFNIASWNGTAWSSLGAGLNLGGGRALAAWSDGTGRALYAGGMFNTAGTVAANNVARWDGATWSSVGGGVNGPVNAILVGDLGSGSSLYAAGQFTMAGTTPVVNVARWDGLQWSTMGDPLMAVVNSLAVFDDGSGSGPALYAGGSASVVGAPNVSKWNGSGWIGVLGGVGTIPSYVYSLLVHDDGTGGGPSLYVAGLFDGAGTTSAHNIARWNGHWWEEVAGSADGAVNAMAECRGGSGGPTDLIVGGYLRYAGGKPSRYIARLSKTAMIGTGFCYGDGSDPTVNIQCPCLNAGLLHHGCASATFQGARLGASGTVPGDVTLTASNIRAATLTLLLSGSTVVNGGVAFGDGIRCISGATHRLGIQIPTLNTVAFRAPPEAPGSVVLYEILYRDPFSNFCPPALFNVTNAVEVDW